MFLNLDSSDIEIKKIKANPLGFQKIGL